MKNKTLLALLTLLFIITFFSTAQAQIDNKKYKTESIYFKGFKYVKNGVEYPVGFFGKNLKKEMEVSPNAVIEYKRYEKKRNTALVIYSIGLATVISGLVVDDNNLRNGLLIGGAGVTIVSFVISDKADESFEKAVWIRNGEILN